MGTWRGWGTAAGVGSPRRSRPGSGRRVRRSGLLWSGSRVEARVVGQYGRPLRRLRALHPLQARENLVHLDTEDAERVDGPEEEEQEDERDHEAEEGFHGRWIGVISGKLPPAHGGG